MRTSHPGEIKNPAYANGFILLRGLLVIFMVIICFAAVLSAMAVFSHQGARMLEWAKREINERNETVRMLIL